MKDKISISRLLVISLAFMMLLCFTSFADDVQTSGTSRIAAKVNDANITESELENATDKFIPRRSFHGKGAMQKRDKYRKQAIEQLIENELIYQEAKRRGMTVNKDELDAMIRKRQEGFKDQKEFSSALKGAGITIEEYRQRLEKEELVRRLTKEEFEDKSIYSDKELEDYYDENKSKFIRPEGFKLKYIFLKAASGAASEQKMEKKRIAEQVLDRINAGEEFTGLAYKYSEDDYRVKGGDLGWVHKGRLDPEIEIVMLDLDVGEVSHLIETPSGYHIIRVEEKRFAEQAAFRDVKDKLKTELESKRYKEIKEAFINKLKEKAKIEIIKN